MRPTRGTKCLQIGHLSGGGATGPRVGPRGPQRFSRPPRSTAPAPLRGVMMIGMGMAERGLVWPRQGRVVAGVLVGLANRFGVGPGVARLLFVLSMLLPGPQILA